MRLFYAGSLKEMKHATILTHYTHTHTSLYTHRYRYRHSYRSIDT